MLFNYLKISFRIIFKNKLFSLLNIIGLGISMAICLMIILYLADQAEVDRSHVNKERIFRIYITDTESALDWLGIQSSAEAIGKTFNLSSLSYHKNSQQVNIIGIISDFNYRLLYESIGPLILQYSPSDFNYAAFHYVSGSRKNIQQQLAAAAQVLPALQPLDYYFFEDLMAVENNIVDGFVSISAWCSGFIILIALMGLLGMTMYSTELRIKEIGVRKVLGASIAKISCLLRSDYIRLVLLAGLIAMPLAWFGTDTLLQAFAFRTEISLWIFPAVVSVVLGLALLTIGSQTIKAALANPVHTLRED